MTEPTLTPEQRANLDAHDAVLGASSDTTRIIRHEGNGHIVAYWIGELGGESPWIIANDLDTGATWEAPIGPWETGYTA